ncbi:MAG: lycopene cyclase family protein [Bacteroidota bacterium]
MKQYDYAILGGGGAGLSLLCHLHREGALQSKRLVIIEPQQKTKHDRTWSFWEEGVGPFESIVQHQWKSLGVHNDHHQATYPLTQFSYKLIRSSDLYAYVDDLLRELPNVDRISAYATNITPSESGVTFTAGDEEYSATWAFSSLPHELRHNEIEEPYLDQHFRGWFIRTEQPTFDPDHATLMDFRTPQYDETRFFYVLPTSPTEAMVEIAIFSNTHLRREAYDQAITNYLSEHWNLLAAPGSKKDCCSDTPLWGEPKAGGACYFEVYHTEQGVIPMTTYPYPRQHGRLLHIGLGGGYARPSTGYTFYNMQKKLRTLAQDLANESAQVRGHRPWPKRHILYDATLLDILDKGRLMGADVFPDLFRRNPTARVLRFLNGETSLMEELQLMSTTHIPTFARAFVAQL